MIGIVVVSHSAELANAAINFVNQMKFNEFKLLSASGINNGQDFGTNPFWIAEQIKKANANNGVLVICDLGSSIINTEIAISDFLPAELQKKVIIANCPFLEGLLVAAISNSNDITLKEIKLEVEKTKNFSKL